MVRGCRVTVRPADAVHFVTSCIVGVVSSTMAARKTEEGHGGHARGSENHAEDVEVHLFRVYLSSREIPSLSEPAGSKTSPDGIVSVTGML